MAESVLIPEYPLKYGIARRMASLRRPVLSGLLVGVAYYLGALIGFALTSPTHSVSILWPPNAILLAALLLTPRKEWWIVLLGVFPAHLAVQLQSGVPVLMILSWFVSNTSEALIGAFCVRYFIDGPLRFDNFGDVGIFTIFAVIFSPFVTSFLDAGFVVLNEWRQDDFWQVWRMRFPANALVTLTLVPAIVLWIRNGVAWLRRASLQCYVEASLLISGLLIVSFLVFSRQNDGPDTVPALVYMPLPFLLWAAMRFGPGGVSTSLLVVALLSTWGVRQGHGPFATSSSDQNVLSLQLFLIAISLPLTFLAALVEERRESEQNFRTLVETTAAVPWQADSGTLVFTYVGPQAVTLLGYPLERWYEKDFWTSHLHPDDQEFAVNTCLALSKSAEDFEFEYRMIASSGETIWVHDIVKCEHRDGNPVELRGFMLDISERKRAEEALRESEERISLAADTAGLGLWVWDAKRDESWVTPEGRRLFGWAESEPVNLERFIRTLHPDDREPTRHAVLQSLRSGGDYIAEYRVVLSDGAIRWIATRGRIEFDGNGRPLRLRGVSIDITERKTADHALRESEARFRTMADTAPVMIWMSGTDRLCIFLNKGWLDFTGRTVEQELGNGWAEGVHPDDFDRCLESYVNFFNARQEFTMEYRLRRFDGEYCWVLDHGVPRFAPDGTFLGYIGTAIDISEHKRAELTLEKERAFLRQVIDIDPNFIFAKDREGHFTLVNQAVADAYGTTVEDLIGKTDADFNSNREELEFFHRMDLEVMDSLQERFIPEEHLTDAQGKIRWLQTVKRPIVDKDGSANQILGASTDITERKQAESELQHNRQELAHVTRISTMGELAASLAHELNQPLTAIMSNAQAAQRFMAANPADLEEVREILKDIVQDDSRASEVIQRMRGLVRKEEVAFVPLDIAEVIRDVARLVHSDAVLLNVDVALELNFGLPLVRGDRVQLQQVVLNLMLNAFDAMKDCPIDERRVVLQAEQDRAGMTKVSVCDRGTGLGADKLDRIFQPFYTTKRDGLGMGLSISRSIIEDHGGHLWVENNPDRGATFCFTVPMGDGHEG
jgi:two-component system, LuxR family, sensor kinase FixL